MENCKANNIPEKRFLEKLLEIGWVIIKHLYKYHGSFWHQKYFTKPLANFFENTYNMYGADLQPGGYFTHSSIF